LTGNTVFLRAQTKQRELLKEEVTRLLPRSISQEELEAHFQYLPKRYYQIHPAKEIVTDLDLVHRFLSLQSDHESKTALRPVLTWHNNRDRGYTRLKICSRDRSGLFSIMTGSFGAVGLNILSAQVFTRQDKIALDTFYVTDSATGGPVARQEREQFEKILIQALTDGDVDFPTLIRHQKSGRWPYSALSEERIPVRIDFDNSASDNRTVIEIETEDQLGLLYTLTRALTDLDLDISLAKVLTEKGAATDNFYVSEPQGGQIRSPERRQQIESTLRAVLSQDNPGSKDK
jgi:[protein-PII] uridylyltransferase